MMLLIILLAQGVMARDPRGLLTLNDPLDCLSQVVCGLNTYPPVKPNAKSNNANDFAFLLKNAIRKLRSETPNNRDTAGLRGKLLSESKCGGSSTCPFNYAQMMGLISSSLEGEKTVSYTSSVVLPMVGYLIKSRNYTGVLSATFRAVQRVNECAIENDRENRPVDYTSVMEEIVNGGGGGLTIVDSSNEAGSSSDVMQDDEFDAVLAKPYNRNRPVESYKVVRRRRTTTSPPVLNHDSSSEEDQVEQRQRPNNHHVPPPVFGMNRI